MSFISPCLSVAEPLIYYLNVVKFSTDSNISLNIFLKPSPFSSALCVLLYQGIKQSAKEHDTTPIKISVIKKAHCFSQLCQ